MPNPFYQIYEGAASCSQVPSPIYLRQSPGIGILPDLDVVPTRSGIAAQLLFLCSPGNPTGAVMPGYLRRCARDRRSPWLHHRSGRVLQRTSTSMRLRLRRAFCKQRTLPEHPFERCVVFHSLSKRSSVPGLRSGFVAGDPQMHASSITCIGPITARDVGTHAARERRGVARRCARDRESRAVSREIRPSAADTAARNRRGPTRCCLLSMGHASRMMKPSRVSSMHVRT